MPVFANNSIAACADWAGVRAIFSRKTSAICSPTVISGFSAVIGSWKIMATWSPRSARICAFGQRQQIARLAAVVQQRPALQMRAS
jgi:hypothetical protein